MKTLLKNKYISLPTKEKYDEILKIINKNKIPHKISSWDIYKSKSKLFIDSSVDNKLYIHSIISGETEIPYEEAIRILGGEEKTLWNLEIGDIITDLGSERTVLGVRQSTKEAGQLVDLSFNNPNNFYWATVTSCDLEEKGYKVKQQKETVELTLDGETIQIPKEDADEIIKKYLKK